MANEISVASTSDSLAAVREAANLPPELTEEEKQEAAEVERARTENGNNGLLPKKVIRRIDKLTLAARTAERERDELRAKLAQYEKPGHQEKLNFENGNGDSHEELDQQESRRRSYVENGIPVQTKPAAEPAQETIEESQPAKVQEVPAATPQGAAPDPEFMERANQFYSKMGEAERQEMDQEIGEAIKNGAVPPAYIVREIIALENGPAVLKDVLKSREKCWQLGQMSQTAAAIELGRISQRLATPAAPIVSKAPPPIVPLRGSGTRGAVDLDDPNLDYQSFKKAREPQARAWRQGVRR